jgi:hypothetical protein
MSRCPVRWHKKIKITTKIILSVLYIIVASMFGDADRAMPVGV